MFLVHKQQMAHHLKHHQWPIWGYNKRVFLHYFPDTHRTLIIRIGQGGPWRRECSHLRWWKVQVLHCFWMWLVDGDWPGSAICLWCKANMFWVINEWWINQNPAKLRLVYIYIYTVTICSNAYITNPLLGILYIHIYSTTNQRIAKKTSFCQTGCPKTECTPKRHPRFSRFKRPVPSGRLT